MVTTLTERKDIVCLIYKYIFF